MAQPILSQAIFQDKDKAREFLESIIWPDGPVCPHCGQSERIYTLKGKAHREGLYKCGKCRKQFTVTVGTLFEKSKIPLNIWLQAAYYMCASKKGVSSHQLHRMLDVTYKTAWFMTHRLREAMKDPVFQSTYRKLGGNGKVVEADETYWGSKWTVKERKMRRKAGLGGPRGTDHKQKIFSLVERGGDVHSFHVPFVTRTTLAPIMRQQIQQDTHICTDEWGAYKRSGQYFTSHQSVQHKHGEYARGPIHTNTIENYFSILKRGLVGTFHHVGARHLKRYIGEFDFRYNNRKVDDLERTGRALTGIAGKRLFYSKVVG